MLRILVAAHTTDDFLFRFVDISSDIPSLLAISVTDITVVLRSTVAEFDSETNTIVYAEAEFQARLISFRVLSGQQQSIDTPSFFGQLDSLDLVALCLTVGLLTGARRCTLGWAPAPASMQNTGMDTSRLSILGMDSSQALAS